MSSERPGGARPTRACAGPASGLTFEGASESVSTRSGPRASLWLLLLVAPVWALGLHHSLAVRDQQLEPRPARAWHARYARLLPHLAGAPRVAIVYDPSDPSRSNKRLFHAQYVLAPTVVFLRGKRLPEIRPRGVPLIYDFRDPQALAKLLTETEAAARRAGVVMTTVRVARGLALVTMKRQERAGED